MAGGVLAPGGTEHAGPDDVASDGGRDDRDSAERPRCARGARERRQLLPEAGGPMAMRGTPRAGQKGTRGPKQHVITKQGKISKRKNLRHALI